MRRFFRFISNKIRCQKAQFVAFGQLIPLTEKLGGPNAYAKLLLGVFIGTALRDLGECRPA